MEKIVLFKQEGKDFRKVLMDTSLETLQKAVGGYIEYVRLGNGFDAIVNEEVHLQEEAKYNCSAIMKGYGNSTLCVANLWGNVIFVKSDKDGDIDNLTDEEIDTLFEEYIRMNRNEH